MNQRRALDTYCKAGGATRGYQQAGFYVVGVDIEPQPNYVGDEFIQADALDVLADLDYLATFDLLAGSPPCHDHTPLASLSGLDGSGWLLAETRKRFMASGRPWVIENVEGAPMRPDLKLCGCQFKLRLERVRWFELSHHFGLIPVMEHRRHTVRTATKNRRALWEQGWNVSITGDVGVYLGPEAMGIDWMTGNELSQAIPPAYTKYIGELLPAELEDVI